MKKRIVSILLATVLTASMMLGGCGGKDTSTQSEGETDAQEEASGDEDTSKEEASQGEESGEEEAAGTEEAAPPAVSHDTELTLEVYDVAANYQESDRMVWKDSQRQI